MSLSPQTQQSIEKLTAQIDATHPYFNDHRLWHSLLDALHSEAQGLTQPERDALYEAFKVFADAAPWSQYARQIPTAWLKRGEYTEHQAEIALCREFAVNGEAACPQWLLDALANAPLTHITELSFNNIKTSDKLISALCALELEHIVALSLVEVPLKLEQLEQLCASALFNPNLKRLELRWNKLNAACAAVLAGCEGLSGLNILDLGSNPIGEAGRVALGKSEHLSDRAKVSARAIATVITPIEADAGRAIFGDVRSALQQGASPHSWATICDLIARQEPMQAELETIPYAEQALARWPAQQRPLMELWRDSLLNDAPIPAAAYLARAVQLSNYKINAQRAGRIGKFMADAGVEHLTLSDGEPSQKVLNAYLIDHQPKGLRSLEFNYNPKESDLTTICDRGHYVLEHLSLGRPNVYGERFHNTEIKALMEGRCVQELRSLALHATQLDLPGWSDLAQAPWWSKLTALALHIWASARTAEGSKALAPALRHGIPMRALERLTLYTPYATGIFDGLDVEAFAAELPSLREILLSISAPGDLAWQLLGALGPQLETLSLQTLSYHDQGAILQLEELAMPKLKSLSLSFERDRYQPFNHQGASSLAMHLPRMAFLRDINALTIQNIYAEAPELLEVALSELPEGLRALNITDVSHSGGGVEALTRQALPQLTTLKLERCKLGVASRERLERSPWWSQLETLWLDLSDEGPVDHVVRLPDGLREFSLNARYEEGTHKLLQEGLPEGLEVLRITGGALASKSYKALLSQLDALPRLHTLDLDENTITAKMVKLLLDHPRLGELPIIKMRSNRLGFSGKQSVLDSARASVAFKSNI